MRSSKVFAIIGTVPADEATMMKLRRQGEGR
jgi:hypothetical protein